MTEKYVKADKHLEHWMNTKWRPAMGWVYMVICICDFIIFPVLWSWLQAYHDGKVKDQWEPLTLQGAGLFHLAMGAVLGIAAWSRGQEKIRTMDYSSKYSSRYEPEESDDDESNPRIPAIRRPRATKPPADDESQ